MKKFIAITFAIMTFVFTTTAIQAKPVLNNSVGNNSETVNYKNKKSKTYYQTRYIKNTDTSMSKLIR